MKKSPNIALVYDRVNKFGGAEQVLLALHEAFPDAPLYTSVYDKTYAQWANVFHVIPSFLQHIPFLRTHHELLAPLMPLAFESFVFSQYDIVISVTSEAAKGIITKPETTHICYMLTPTRYLWSHEREYKSSLLGVGLRLWFRYLKSWDKVASLRPDFIVPISSVVQKRIHDFYNRETSPIIYPPVSWGMFSAAETNTELKEKYAIVVSRLVPYKRIDLAIAACITLQIPLHIIGTGSDEKRLKRIAGNSPYIHFYGYVPEDEVKRQLEGAWCFISPAYEDFGIAAVEALSCGVPVVCYSQSGTAETIVDGKTGVAFLHQTSEDVVRALKRVDAIQWQRKEIRNSVQAYSTERFVQEWKTLVKDIWKNI